MYSCAPRRSYDSCSRTTRTNSSLPPNLHSARAVFTSHQDHKLQNSKIKALPLGPTSGYKSAEFVCSSVTHKYLMNSVLLRQRRAGRVSWLTAVSDSQIDQKSSKLIDWTVSPGSNRPASSRSCRAWHQLGRTRKSQADKDGLVYTWSPAWIKHADNSLNSWARGDTQTRQDAAQRQLWKQKIKSMACHHTNAWCSQETTGNRRKTPTVCWWSGRQICRVRAQYGSYSSMWGRRGCLLKFITLTYSCDAPPRANQITLYESFPQVAIKTNKQVDKQNRWMDTLTCTECKNKNNKHDTYTALLTWWIIPSGIYAVTDLICLRVE